MRFLKTCFFLYLNAVLGFQNLVYIHNDKIQDKPFKMPSLDPKQNEYKESKKIKMESSDNVVLGLVDNLEIYFYGGVTEANCFELTSALTAMDLKAKAQKVYNKNINPVIELHIQSPGGSLMPTFFVCDKMKQIETPIHTFIDGYCASAASLISVCGKRRYMTKHSAMLIHQLSGAASGKFNELKNEIDNLGFFMGNVKEIYLTNTKFEEKKLQELLETDLWLNANECLKYGLVDEII